MKTLSILTRYLSWVAPLVLLAALGCVSPDMAPVSRGGADVAGTQSKPSQILYNGKILTVDDEFSIAEAIAISGEHIVAVGDTDDLLSMADAKTKLLDLEGRTVIPGFIDNHLHYLRGTHAAAYELRLHGVTSR